MQTHIIDEAYNFSKKANNFLSKEKYISAMNEKKANNPRLAHYNPRFYLKGFCANQKQPRLYCVDKIKKEIRFQHIKKISCERDYYKSDDNDHPNIYENFLANNLEPELSEALQEIKATFSLQNRFEDLICLISWLYVSNPYYRKIFNNAIDEVRKIQLEMTENLFYQGKLADSQRFAKIVRESPELLEEIKQNQFEFGFSSGFHFQMVIEAQNNVFNWLMLRRWILLKTPTNTPGFITCDRPTFLSYHTKNAIPLGLCHKKTQLFFPISNKLAVIGAFEFTDNIEKEADKLEIANFNSVMINSANRNFYAENMEHYYLLNNDILPISQLVK